MENGFYRVSDTEISTDDWVRLNFDTFNARIMQSMCEKDPHILECLQRIGLPEEPEEPQIEDYDDEDEFQFEYDDWEEAYAEWEAAQQLHAWPVAWNTMWACTGHRLLIPLLVEAGFVVYETSGELEDFGPVVFGVDGGGYNFYGAHFIPLRAALCRLQWEKDLIDDEKYANILWHLATTQQAKGGVSRDEFIARWAKEKNAA